MSKYQEFSDLISECAFLKLESEISNICIKTKCCLILGDVNGHTATADDCVILDDFFLSKQFEVDEEFIMGIFNLFEKCFRA